MNPLHQQMLGLYAAELGQPLCNLLVAANECRRVSRAGFSVDAPAAVLEQTGKEVRRIVQDWNAIGISPDELGIHEDAPDNYRLLQAACGENPLVKMIYVLMLMN